MVVNAACLFNSLYLDEAVRRLRDTAEPDEYEFPMADPSGPQA